MVTPFIASTTTTIPVADRIAFLLLIVSTALLMTMEKAARKHERRGSYICPEQITAIVSTLCVFAIFLKIQPVYPMQCWILLILGIICGSIGCIFVDE